MASSRIGGVFVDFGMNAGSFEKGAQKGGRAMDRLARKAEAAGKTIAAALAGGQLISGLRNAIDLFGVQQDAIASVEAVLKTTGGAAGLASEELQKVASSLQDVTTFGDEEILRGATSNLLTFGNIVGDTFLRAQEAVLDLSAQFKVGLKESAIQLGKALNDPIAGISALSRVGIAFTKQQKDQIKTLVESGDVLSAQAIILDEIEKFYGQAAESFAKTTAGKMQQAANAFGDALEAVGEAIAPIAVGIADAVKDISVWFSSLSVETRKFLVVGAAATAGLGALAGVAAGLAVVLGALASPILAVAAGIGVISGAVAAFWPNLKALAQSAAAAFKDVYDTARKWLLDALEPVISRVQGFISRIADLWARLRASLGFEDAVENIKDTLKPVTEQVQLGVDKLTEIWNRGNKAANDSLATLTKEQAEAQVNMAFKAAAEAEKAAKAQEGAQKAAEQTTSALVQQGITLAGQLKSPYDEMLAQQAALQAAYDSSKISAEQLGNAQARAALVAQNAYAGMVSDIAGNLQGLFGESKAFAIAQAIINTYEGFTKALAAYPPPFNYAAAAAVLASGFAQVANIKKTTKSTGTGGAGTGGGAGAEAGPTQAPQRLIVQGIGANDLFTGSSVRGLAEQLLEFQRNGGQVVLR